MLYYKQFQHEMNLPNFNGNTGCVKRKVEVPKVVTPATKY